ncbi:unnamed protein product [Acanthoscelides obtectus]|uniref:Uncharacterized protein n=1 Tax=Acanthoscelides obtectus TaxID=200917 RepID=A0A9P0NVT8_ACAOB|nr:unnamed protein product [Acanthoscelides obtectus]CAK1678501.1 hypothetical protein AOBTE_LOCUS31940 [Acanthoscelides obtectus]
MTNYEKQPGVSDGKFCIMNMNVFAPAQSMSWHPFQLTTGHDLIFYFFFYFRMAYVSICSSKAVLWNEIILEVLLFF